MLPPHILTIDDCIDQRLLLRDQLELAGYRVSGAATAAEALAILASDPPQLITLDLRLPDLPGEELCRRIRLHSSVPILVATLYGDEPRKVALLDAGADDFLVKPLPRQEFLARIRAVMRRSAAPAAAQAPRLFQFGALRIDLARRQVSRAGVAVHLCPKEWAVLLVLLRAAGAVVSHQQIIAEVWEAEDDSRLASLHVVVSQLRLKLEPGPGRQPLILTVPGVGYRLAPAIASPAAEGVALPRSPSAHPRGEVLDFS